MRLTLEVSGRNRGRLAAVSGDVTQWSLGVISTTIVVAVAKSWSLLI